MIFGGTSTACTAMNLHDLEVAPNYVKCLLE